jgi:hypothetical protein
VWVFPKEKLTHGVKKIKMPILIPLYAPWAYPVEDMGLIQPDGGL